jgi:predicted lipoprotein with Yx(FWY)xxD motif
MKTQQRSNALTATAALAMSILAVTGCSSKSSSTAAVAPSSAPAAATAPMAAAVVTTATGPVGTFLADASGRTLYRWMADTSSTSTCSGKCATFWPPLLTSGAATAAGSAKAGLLGVTKRADGTSQVTYGGHPLYYFAEDKSAGATSGQGSDGFGAKWWVVDPTGASITASASPAATTPARSGY